MVADETDFSLKTSEDIARFWFVCMQDEDVTIEEIRQWQEWIAESEEHAVAYDRIVATWQASEDIVPSALWPEMDELKDSEEESYQGDIPVAEYLKQQRQKTSINVQAMPTLNCWNGTGKIAAAVSFLVAIVIAAGVFLNGPVPVPLHSEKIAETIINTGRAERQSAHLSDGSLIDVGAASRVVVDFTDDKRLIEFASGEAFFEVAPDANRPFVVSTPLGNVTAIGTAFNIKLSGDRILVSVVEGKVGMNFAEKITDTRKATLKTVNFNNEDLLRLDAGEVATYSVGADLSIQPSVFSEENIMWREGQLTYRSEMFKYVIADLARYSDLDIVIDDLQVENLQYSGTVMLDRIPAWLAALPKAFPVEIQRAGRTVTIRSHKK